MAIELELGLHEGEDVAIIVEARPDRRQDLGEGDERDVDCRQGRAERQPGENAPSALRPGSLGSVRMLLWGRRGRLEGCLGLDRVPLLQCAPPLIHLTTRERVFRPVGHGGSGPGVPVTTNGGMLQLVFLLVVMLAGLVLIRSWARR